MPMRSLLDIANTILLLLLLLMLQAGVRGDCADRRGEGVGERERRQAQEPGLQGHDARGGHGGRGCVALHRVSFVCVMFSKCGAFLYCLTLQKIRDCTELDFCFCVMRVWGNVIVLLLYAMSRDVVRRLFFGVNGCINSCDILAVLAGIILECV